MKVYSQVLGDLQTNCYLVTDEQGNAAVIDPAASPERILQQALQLAVQIRAVLLTHAHFDHTGAARAIAEAARCPVWVNEEEEKLDAEWTGGALYYTDDYDDGDTVRVGGLTFMVYHTPGHTPGSVCLKCGTALFTGDTLFAGSCGRVDLPGGSYTDMARSLRRIAEFEGDLAILPGHGPASTLLQERQSNPYLHH